MLQTLQTLPRHKGETLPKRYLKYYLPPSQSLLGNATQTVETVSRYDIASLIQIFEYLFCRSPAHLIPIPDPLDNVLSGIKIIKSQLCFHGVPCVHDQSIERGIKRPSVQSSTSIRAHSTHRCMVDTA